VQALNPAYKIPSHDSMGSKILDTIYEDVKVKMKNELEGVKAVLIQDRWSSSVNDPAISHSLHVVFSTYFIASDDPGIEKASAEYCAQLIQKTIAVIQKKYKCTIIGVIADNCSTMKAMQRLIKERFTNLEAYGCN